MNTNLHTIRFAIFADVNAIREFIRAQWRSDHIYYSDEAFFSYEFVYTDTVNFVIAENKDKEIEGILGFIQYGENRNGSDVFTVIWKVLPKTGDPQLGIRLLKYLLDKSGVRTVSTVGAHPKTLPIYSFLGYKTGTLRHYYMINPFLSAYTVIKNVPGKNANFPKSSEGIKRIQEIKDPGKIMNLYNAIPRGKTGPRKSAWFFEKRYIKHTYFKYHFFLLTSATGANEALLVLKKINISGAVILRVMDMIGDQNALMDMRIPFLKLLKKEKAEYLDFYQYGIPDTVMKSAGFTYKRKKSSIIVPDYFDPFEQKNIDLHFFTTQKRNFRIYKGDGDQDRPNSSRTI